jgi:hypothetical protein
MEIIQVVQFGLSGARAAYVVRRTQSRIRTAATSIYVFHAKDRWQSKAQALLAIRSDDSIRHKTQALIDLLCFMCGIQHTDTIDIKRFCVSILLMLESIINVLKYR